ncbi:MULTISPECIES: hypothetical protein [unclassified Ectothiorhodospira]|nr:MULTISPECIES: hypothetical protein [unclassified Ectothiorhodospira]MCG5516379.1 hypothetical protein [Ectothiorhodospira sp. 9100]MCG5519371.1 hypothetical protein [Ectothiorhodospira sp. 9905]
MGAGLARESGGHPGMAMALLPQRIAGKASSHKAHGGGWPVGERAIEW